MQAPAHFSSTFFNYKGTHNVVPMAVCDAHYCFTLIDVGDAGRHSDGSVLCHSAFWQAMENGELSLPSDSNIEGILSPVPYFFVGNAAFPLKMYMLWPYPGRYLPDSKRIFNYCLPRARRIIENTFGIIAAKFRIFQRPIVASPEKVTCITKAACSLHNYLKLSEVCNVTSNWLYCPPGYIKYEDRDGNLIPGDCRQEAADGIRNIQRVGSNTHTASIISLSLSMIAACRKSTCCPLTFQSSFNLKVGPSWSHYVTLILRLHCANFVMWMHLHYVNDGLHYVKCAVWISY